jgi:hypothetical protein
MTAVRRASALRGVPPYPLRSTASWWALATFSPPMFHSPLGAPASYAAIDLDERTNKAILRALEQVFPRVRAFGWHKDLDLIIDGFSPFEERVIDQLDFEKMRMALAKPGLVSTVEVDAD